MRSYFTFAGRSCQDFNTYISGQGTYNAPARIYKSYEVPGRNGNLYVDEKRYENIELVYPAFIFEDMRTNFRALKNYLLSKTGYQRLEDTYNPDEFRLAVYKNSMEPEIDQRHEVAIFDIAFDCKPQRFLKIGEKVQTLTASGSIFNPTDQISRPLLRVYGQGTLKIGNQTITISASDVYTDIDCEMMDCYKGTTSKNANVSLTGHNFPELQPGTNNFTLNSGITKVEITPRWWRL